MNRVIAILFLASIACFGQGWSGLDASRKSAYWPNAGHIDTTTGNWNGIPSTYTVSCSTITPSGDTTGATDSAAISTAISSCPAGEYIYLNGTSLTPFYVTYIQVLNHSSIVFRGNGPLNTIVKTVNGNGVNCGFLTNFCIGNSAVSFLFTNMYGATGAQQANWTAGYSAGTTAITLDKVGSGSQQVKATQLILMDQNNVQAGIKYISGDGATATVHTFNPHGFSTNDSIGIGCALGDTAATTQDGTGYGGWKTITVVDSTTFTYSSTNTSKCVGISQWVDQTKLAGYATNAVVINNGTFYRSLISANKDVPPSANWDSSAVSATSPTWQSTTTYALSQVVVYNNIAYKSNVSSNLNNQPDLTTSCSPNPCVPKWAVVTGGSAMKDPWGTAEPLFQEDVDYVGRAGTGQQLGRNYDGVDRAYLQISYVQSVNAGTKQVTITPPLYLQGINSNQNPGATWITPISEVGIEDLTLDVGTGCAARGLNASAPARSGTNCSSANQAITFNGAFNSWLKDVSILGCYRQCVGITGYSSNIEIIDSYLWFAWNAGSESYGIEPYIASNIRIENNIFDKINNAVLLGPSSGVYMGYNYCHDAFSLAGSGQFQGYPSEHDPGASFFLMEGNTCPAFQSDSYWGSATFTTLFRNWFYGADQLGPNPPAQPPGPKTAATEIVTFMSFQRYGNVIGNVLGPTTNTGPFYTTYNSVANGSCTGATQSGASASIFTSGFGGSDNIALPSNVCDTNINPSMFRWGNGDTISNAIRWCGNSGNTGWGTTCSSTSEVPTGLSKYANAVPVAETVANSMIYGSNPSWYLSTKGTVVWPPHGPAVTGTTGPTLGASMYATKIPAQLCFEGLTTTATAFNGRYKNFDATACYQGTVPPYVVTIVPQGNGSGTVTGTDGMNCTITNGVASGTCSENHNQGDNPTYTLSTTDTFNGWGGPCTGTGATCSPTFPAGDLSISVNLVTAPTAALTCPNGCSINCGQAISLTGTMGNMQNQAGSSWALSDPNGTIVLACAYNDGSGCLLSGGTTALTLLTGGAYTLQATSGGVPSNASTKSINLNACSKGFVAGGVQ